MQKLILSSLLGLILTACAPSSDKDSIDKAEEAKQALPSIMDQMQGHWQSDDDPMTVIQVSAAVLETIYDGQTASIEAINLVSDCTSMTSDPAGKYFTLTDQEDPSFVNCYYFISSGETSLHYSFLPRGNTLSFSKKP